MLRADIVERIGIPWPGSSRLLLATGAALLVLAAGVDEGSATAHRPHRNVPAASTRDTDTSATGTLPTKPPQGREPQHPVADDDDKPLPPPFHLPQASRTRMRDCGLKWQAMKESGEAGEQIWRDFATRCLAAANGPLDKRSDR